MSYRPRTRVWSAAALSASVVSVATLRDHLRITSADEDDILAFYGASASVAVERWTQRLLMVRTTVLRLQDLPSGQCQIELPGGAVSSVTSVVADGETITGAVAVGDAPAMLVPAADWPVVVGEGYPVTITYEAGYSTVPQDLIHAVLLIAGEMYMRRANGDDKQVYTVPVSAEYLMAPYRIRAIA